MSKQSKLSMTVIQAQNKNKKKKNKKKKKKKKTISLPYQHKTISLLSITFRSQCMHIINYLIFCDNIIEIEEQTKKKKKKI